MIFYLLVIVIYHNLDQFFYFALSFLLSFVFLIFLYSIYIFINTFFFPGLPPISINVSSSLSHLQFLHKIFCNFEKIPGVGVSSSSSSVSVFGISKLGTLSLGGGLFFNSSSFLSSGLILSSFSFTLSSTSSTVWDLLAFLITSAGIAKN